MSDCHHTCNGCQSTGSVHQTLDELEFERGIWSAAQSGDLERIVKLIEKGTHPNQCDKGGYTALHYAARNGHFDVCRILLQHGACVNSKTRAGGATALHRACSAGQAKIVQLLVSKGASIDLQDFDGKTALHRAAENGHHEIYKNLQQCVTNSSINECKDNKGNKPCDYFNNTIDSNS